MDIRILKPRQTLNNAFRKVKPICSEIDHFKKNLIHLLDHIREGESKEHRKNFIADFHKNTAFAPQHDINTRERNDLVIHNGGKNSTIAYRRRIRDC
jgi:hypothetical protein